MEKKVEKKVANTNFSSPKKKSSNTNQKKKEFFKKEEKVTELILITRTYPQKSFPDRVYLHSESLKKLGVSIGQSVIISSLQEEKNPVDQRNRVIATLWRSDTIFENRN